MVLKMKCGHGCNQCVLVRVGDAGTEGCCCDIAGPYGAKPVGKGKERQSGAVVGWSHAFKLQKKLFSIGIYF